MHRGFCLALLTLVVLVAGCGGLSQQLTRNGLEGYVARVEPIRLGINRLLNRADPILTAYADHRIGPAAATRRMGQLERGVADYAVRIAALEPVPVALRPAQDAYAHTFVLQDTYLSTLVAALPKRQFDQLPHFQNDQRAAIIAWRTRLEVLAKQVGAKLPADLQVAGRGEISPAPGGD